MDRHFIELTLYSAYITVERTRFLTRFTSTEGLTQYWGKPLASFSRAWFSLTRSVTIASCATDWESIFVVATSYQSSQLLMRTDGPLNRNISTCNRLRVVPHFPPGDSRTSETRARMIITAFRSLLVYYPWGLIPLSRNFYVRTCVKFTFANKIGVLCERSYVSVKVEPRSTSRLISTLYILPLFYLRD